MSPRPVAGTEIQRILAIVPWIVAHPGAAKLDVATRFGMTIEQLDDDLALVLMIGVPPYSPGDYLDVDDDGEFVTIRLADQFSRPLRLTPAEGLALLAAGRTLLAVPGSDPAGPLATALTKLEGALDLPNVIVKVGEPTYLAAVRDAAARGEPPEIPGEASWGGLAGTLWWIHPQRGIAAVLLTQRFFGHAHPYAARFKRNAYRALLHGADRADQ